MRPSDARFGRGGAPGPGQPSRALIVGPIERLPAPDPAPARLIRRSRPACHERDLVHPARPLVRRPRRRLLRLAFAVSLVGCIRIALLAPGQDLSDPFVALGLKAMFLAGLPLSILAMYMADAINEDLLVPMVAAGAVDRTYLALCWVTLATLSLTVWSLLLRFIARQRSGSRPGSAHL